MSAFAERYNKGFFLRRQAIVFVLFLLFFTTYSYGISENGVLMVVHDREITKDEFLYYFFKTNQEINQQNIVEYLDLFINFQLKLAQAREEHLDQTIGFINELAEYRLLLAAPYLTHKEKEQEFVHEALDRLTFELNASHILVKLDFEASPEDTLKAYTKAMQIRKRILDGEPFEQLALATSGDHMVVRDSGKPGYFTAFQTVYSFESAVYNMNPGEISMPVRSNFGYHVIRLNDRRNSLGAVKNEQEVKELIYDAKDERTQMIEDAFVEKLKIDWSFVENPDALEIIYKLADERVYKGNWIAPADQAFDETLFFIDGKSVDLKQFIDFMSDLETMDRHLSIREYIFSLYRKFVSSRLITYENYKLAEKYPEFRYQLQEYRDAMLLLAITREKVWLKSESGSEEMEEWIEELRGTYHVQINEEVLSSINKTRSGY